MIKICHISTAHSTFDGRIFHKECVSLSDAGYDVSLVITHTKNEVVNGVNIVALKKSNGRFHRMILKPWVALFKALKTKAKIFHFHDPELMFVGLALRLLGKKVVFDSHENVSHQIETKTWLGNKIVRSIVKNVYRLFEKVNIFFYNKVISVTPEIVEFLAPNKGVLIRNYPKSSLTGNDKEVNKKINDKLTFIYAGGLTKIRGIKEICQAIGETKNVKLVLLGVWESQAYKKDCLQGVTNVEYLGAKPIKEVYPIIRNADVGFVNFYYEKNHLNCLPTKSFEYMTCGLPMIISDIPYWSERYSEFSRFVIPTDINSIKKAINWMIDNEEKRTIMGEAGKKAVRDLYSWEAEAKTLIRMYEELS